MQQKRDFPKPIDYLALAIIGLCMLGYLWLAWPASAQSTVTLTPSVTAGDGTLVTNLSWSTSPPLSTGTPCVASSTPTTPQWTGAKAGSGSVTGLTFTADQRLTLVCTFPGDSIVTYTWTNPTTNTNSTPLTDLRGVRIKQTFNATLSADPTVAAAGETHIDVPQTPAPQTTRTVTGITQTGTLRAAAYAWNQANIYSGASNVATKAFQGSFTVTQQVDLIVRSVPNAVAGFSSQ